MKTCQENLESVPINKKMETGNEKHERLIREKEKCKSILALAMAKLRANKITLLRSEQEVTGANNPKISKSITPINKIKEEAMEISEFSYSFENNALINQEMKDVIDSKNSVMEITPTPIDKINEETFLEIDIEIKEEDIDLPC